MAGIIDFPTVVQEALQHFGDLLPNEPQRRHFAEYLTGLFVAERKNVCGINREFAQTTDQSCLNRFLTEADWDVSQLNHRRLAFLQQEPSTRYSAQGVIPIDNTLIDHCGQLIADAGWFWDHAEERYKIAHDYLIVNYVCTSGKHYPLDFRRFQKQDLCEDLEVPFKDHTTLCKELIDWVCDQDIPGAFAFDSYFTNAPILNHIHGKQLADGQSRAYVGSLKFNRKLEYKGQVLKAAELAARIDPSMRKPLQEGDRQQWYFTCTLRIPDVKHKVRIVILDRQQPACHRVEHGAVVGDEQDRARERVKGNLERFARLQVKVVRRFVQHQEVRARGDDDRQREPPPLAAGERGDAFLVLVPAGEQEPAEERLRLRPFQAGAAHRRLEHRTALVELRLVL